MVLNLVCFKQNQEMQFLKSQKLTCQIDLMEVMSKRYLKEEHFHETGKINFETGYVIYQFNNAKKLNLLLKIVPDEKNQSDYWERSSELVSQ